VKKKDTGHWMLDKNDIENRFFSFIEYPVSREALIQYIVAFDADGGFWDRIPSYSQKLSRCAYSAGEPPGVHEEDVLAFSEKALAHQVDETGHGLAGVDRVQEHRFVSREQFHRLDHAGRRDGIPFSDIITETQHGIPRQLAAEARQCRRLPCELENQILLLGLGPADVHPDDRYTAVQPPKSGQKPRVGSGAAAGAHHPVDPQPKIEGLGDDLLGAGRIPQRAQRVLCPAGDDVRPPALGLDLIRHGVYRPRSYRTPRGPP
jgi:hypothetical protein